MDLCWLPSAIMQTTGAMIGIYVAIYLLATPGYFKLIKELSKKCEDEASRDRVDRMKKTPGHAFKGLLIICTATIIANALWLDLLTTNIFLSGGSNHIGFICLTAFFASVVYICIFSILLIQAFHLGYD